MNGEISQATFRESWRVQLRVLKALVLRSFLSLSGGKSIGFLSVMLEPLIFIVAVGSLYVIRSVRSATFSVMISPVAFAVSGYCILWACRFQIMKSQVAIVSNLNLLYHRNVKVLDLLLSRGIVQACFNTLAFFIIFFFVVYFEVVPELNNCFFIVVSWFLVLWYGLDLAIICGVVNAYGAAGNKIVLLLNVIHIFTTGAFFMVDWIPVEYQDIVLLFPMVHATEMMRDGFFGNAVVTHYDPMYLVVMNTVFLYLGLCLVQNYRKSERVYGKAT